MAKFIATIKAIITRIVFASHGFIAIWQVTNFKRDPVYWYLCCPIVLLFFEGIFTLTIKSNQEWKWFCPSVFLYLGSVVPAIWLLELEKVDRRVKNFGVAVINDTFDLTKLEDLKQLQKTLGVNIRLPELQISTETWVTLIEQFLMLILIIGRWMLPKGELTRDQLSQLLLVYIGTAADIIEFFDSFKDEKVSREPLLVYLTLGIWAWSLMQFTVVLTATKSRKSRLSSSSSGGGGATSRKKRQQHQVTSDDQTSCCSIDVWAIAINMLLQDGPFLAFRLTLIVHFKIVSYMNIFFTCKNTLVILLQLYRLYVVQSETRARRRESSAAMMHHHEVSLVSRPDSYGTTGRRGKRKKRRDDEDEDDGDDYSSEEYRPKRRRRSSTSQDTMSDDTRRKKRRDVTSSKRDSSKRRRKRDASSSDDEEEESTPERDKKSRSRTRRNEPSGNKKGKDDTEESSVDDASKRRERRKKRTDAVAD
ncbi:transmembrane protein 26 [Trichogramma pretiosum]|uniref:transmembrane protein 26 n=1 Tax=Trichogramma pretiosum TaxID=7493 RepID=UPI000C71922F|nr:transmembrane protein 26 [Trichogramma pretiosum]